MTPNSQSAPLAGVRVGPRQPERTEWFVRVRFDGLFQGLDRLIVPAHHRQGVAHVVVGVSTGGLELQNQLGRGKGAIPVPRPVQRIGKRAPVTDN